MANHLNLSDYFILGFCAMASFRLLSVEFEKYINRRSKGKALSDKLFDLELQVDTLTYELAALKKKLNKLSKKGGKK